MKGHILFVQPSDSEMMEIKFSLEELGFQVSIQPNAVHAINLARTNPPDIVVTEVLTQPIGGFELAAAFSQGNYGFTSPVIFYTEFYRDERTRRDVTARYGAVHYFVKPFQRDALKKAILQISAELGPSRGEASEGGRSQMAADEANRDANNPSTPEPGFDEIEAAAAESESSGSPDGVETPIPINSQNSSERLGSNLGGAPANPLSEESLSTSMPLTTAEKVDEPPPEEALSPTLIAADHAQDSRQTEEDRRIQRPKPIQVRKRIDKSSLILGLLFLVTFAALFLLWDKFGRTVPPPKSDPQLEGLASVPADSAGTALPAAPGAEKDFQEGAGTSGEIEPMEKEGSPDSAKPPQTQVRSGERDTADNHAISTKAELYIADISTTVPGIHLRQMKRPAMSQDALRKMGAEVFVVRVVVDNTGHVIEAAPLNTVTRGVSLPREILDTMKLWEFSVDEDRGDGVILKHYTVKAVTP